MAVDAPFNFDALLDAIDGPLLAPERERESEVVPEPKLAHASRHACVVYTPSALRDAFFGVGGVRAQVAASSASTAYATRCVLVSKRVHVEFRVPAGAGADATLSAHLGSVYEAALSVDGAACEFAGAARRVERELLDRFAESPAAAPAIMSAESWAALARSAALRQLVLPASGAECLGGDETYERATTRQLDATRCVFEAVDVEVLENETSVDVVALCSLQSAMHALVSFVDGAEAEAEAEADDIGTNCAGAGSRTAAACCVARDTPLGEPLALARAGERLAEEALSLARVRPAYYAQHPYVCTFSNMTAERLLVGTLGCVRAPTRADALSAVGAAGDDGVLIPEKLALGYFMTRNPQLFDLDMRLRESEDDVAERARAREAREDRERPVRERRTAEMRAEFEKLAHECERAERERDVAAVELGALVCADGAESARSSAERALANAELKLAQCKERERRARNAEDGGARSRQEAIERRDAAVTCQKKQRFAHVERALALEAARVLASKAESEIPWSDPLALRLGVRPAVDAAWLPCDAGKCVRIGVRVWYTLAPQQSALDAGNIVWTAAA